MTLIKKIEHVKAIKIRDKDVDIITKSGETIPLVGGRRPLIHFEGKLQYYFLFELYKKNRNI